MKKLKLLLLAITPFLIGSLLSRAIVKFDWYGTIVSIISIVFCLYWFFVGYKSYDYVETKIESIFLGNSFAIVSIVLVLYQSLIRKAFYFNIVGTASQHFFMPMVRVGSWVNSILWIFFRHTNNFAVIGMISFVLMILIYCSGYHVAKVFNEGK